MWIVELIASVLVVSKSFYKAHSIVREFPTLETALLSQSDTPSGRQSHSSFHNGEPCVSASSVRVENPTEIYDANGVKQPFEAPRALETAEVEATVQVPDV